MKKTSASAVYRRLLTYVWPYRYAFALAVLGNILYGIVDASLIKLLEPLLDEGFVGRNVAFIQWFPFIIIGIFLIRGVATFLSTFFMGWVGRHVVMNFRLEIFQHLLALPTTYFDNATSGEILSKIIYNVEQVAEASSEALTELVRESCLVLGLLGVMFSISWRLTLLFFVVAPIMATVIHMVSKRMRTVSGTLQDSMGEVAHVAEEAIEGQRVIKAFGGQAYECGKFLTAIQGNRRLEMKMITTSAINIPLIQCIGAVALAITVYLATGSAEVLGATITPGAFAAMMAAMIALLKPIKQLTKVNQHIQKGLAGASSIFALLDQEREKDTGEKRLTAVQGHIVYDQVCFSYGDTPTLEAISFTVKPGETVAIVGRSGGGKSTLVSLLPRFYEAQGNICIDGVNIRDLPLAHLRDMIAIVSQQVVLFNDTIARNIAYGCEEYSPEAIVAAAQSAYAMEFIERLPRGLDTVVGENGVRLSGGQRQRIAIARAMLKKAPILILDEATSALDTESERYIQAALEKLMSQCTTLVIAHRLSTIENADRIIVLEDGKIIEVGSHQALLASQGAYAELCARQYQDMPAKVSASEAVAV